MVTLALVDDHVLFREALRSVLSTAADLRIVAEAGDAPSARRAIEQHEPDVVLLEPLLSGSGVAFARELLAGDARRRILFVSRHSGDELGADAFEAGALGCLGRSATSAELLSAVRTVARGEPWGAAMPRSAAPALRTGSVRPRLAVEPLSPREQQVFDLLLRGATSENIATELAISRRTVETHRAHILRKLRVRSTAELFRLAARNGLFGD